MPSGQKLAAKNFQLMRFFYIFLFYSIKLEQKALKKTHLIQFQK